MTPPFVHLRVRTRHAAMRSLVGCAALAEHAAALEMPAVGIADDGTLTGVPRFARCALDAGVAPVVGALLRVRPRRPAAHRWHSHALVLLAENLEGWAHLCALVGRIGRDGGERGVAVDWDDLATHAGGLIALSAHAEGAVGALLAARRDGEARAMVRELVEIYGRGNVFLELQRVGGVGEQRVNVGSCALAGEARIGLVATHPARYLRSEDARLHEVLLCLDRGVTLRDVGRPRMPSDEFYLAGPEQMAARFADDPGALAATVEIAARCSGWVPEWFAGCAAVPAGPLGTLFVDVAREAGIPYGPGVHGADGHGDTDEADVARGVQPVDVPPGHREALAAALARRLPAELALVRPVRLERLGGSGLAHRLERVLGEGARTSGALVAARAALGGCVRRVRPSVDTIGIVPQAELDRLPRFGTRTDPLLEVGFDTEGLALLGHRVLVLRGHRDVDRASRIAVRAGLGVDFVAAIRRRAREAPTAESAPATLADHAAWLRRHHPAAYLAVLLDDAAGAPRRLSLLAETARELGVELRGPDVLVSAADCSIEGSAVRLGLGMVQGLSRARAESIASLPGRERIPSIESWLVHASAVHIPRPVLRHLIASGALDGFGHPRAALDAALDFFVRRTADERARLRSGQRDLFECGEPGDGRFGVPHTAEWSEQERAERQRAALGLDTAGLVTMRRAPVSSSLGRFDE